MKRLVPILVVGCMLSFVCHAEDKDSVLKILKAPSSPAANLLGISPSDVQRPTDPSALMVSVQSAAGNFSSFPSTYAFDIAPAWLFNGRNITFEQFVDTNYNFSNVFKQSFVISSAITSKADADTKDLSTGLGIKFSILRGNISKKTIETIGQSQTVLNRINSALTNPLVSLSKSTAFQQANLAGQQKMKDSLVALINVKVISDSLLALYKTINFDRYGWKLDFAGGASLNFPSQEFDRGTINKAGAWLTGGYESENGLSALAIIRYLYNPDKVFADEKKVLQQDNLSTVDAGFRLLYDNHDKFTIGAEGVYRSVLQKTAVNPTWRFALNADYKVGKNQILTLALGRDYDGTFNKDGNVIAALNLILGFGNVR